MSEKTVEEFLYRHAKKSPSKMAVISSENEVTYGQLHKLACGYASFLHFKGLEKGDIVVVRSSQTVDFVVAYLAIHIVGAVVAPLEKNVPLDTLLSIANFVGARMVISVEKEQLQEKFLFVDSSSILKDAKATKVKKFPLQDENDSADILFTTGTTGNSKGVEISHKALVATARNLIDGCEYKEDTVLIVPGPLNHANPIRKLITTIVNGSTIYLLNGMTDVKSFYYALDHMKGSMACCLPPAAVRMLFTLTGDTLGQYANRIDFIESSTAPLPDADKKRLCKLLPNTRLYNNYGSSEAASVCLYDYNANPSKSGCIGKVMRESKVFIVNDQLEIIQSSKENMGCLACAGNTIMKGYVNDPELTSQVLIDGVIYTNDVGYIDDEGFIYIVARKGDVINVGGLKVAPSEVEDVVLGLEDIADCICISVPHPISGQALKLLVVMKEGVEFSQQKLLEYLQQKLESYKVPIQYEEVDKIARTYNGKLDRKAYR